MKKQRFKVSDIYKPTVESIEEQNRRHNLYNYYGIPVGIFTDNNFEYTKEELKAMDLIRRNKDIPSQLQDKLLATKEERHKRINTISGAPEPLIIDAELEEFIRSKQ